MSDHPKAVYNTNVKIGNWFEDICLEEEKLKRYLKTRKEGKLQLKKVRQMFVDLLKEVTLNLPVKGLSYGGRIQLIAPDMPAHRPGTSGGNGIALAGIIDNNDIDRTTTLIDGCRVVGSPLLTPCIRNSFYLLGADGSDNGGRELCFGDIFVLKSVVESKCPLFVECEVKKVNSKTGKCGYVCPKLTDWLNSYCRMRVLPIIKEDREEMLGKPAPPFEKIVIHHAMGGIALAAETDFWFPTYFGEECEISFHSYLDIAKRETAPNFWTFIIGSAD